MPEPEYTTRTSWPAALPLQQAADALRETPFYTRRLGKLTEPIAAWLDATANSLAWLAPYNPNEPGYDMWQAASLVAAAVNGTPVQSAAEVRDFRNCYTDEAARKSLTHSPERPCDRTEAHLGHKHVAHQAAWYCPGVAAVPGSTGGE